MGNKQNVIICRCEEVTNSEIRKAIRDGATNVDAVKRVTRAGMGLCQSHACYKLVAKIISEMTGKPIGGILPQTQRPPIRPISAESLAKSRKSILK